MALKQQAHQLRFLLIPSHFRFKRSAPGDVGKGPEIDWFRPGLWYAYVWLELPGIGRRLCFI